MATVMTALRCMIHWGAVFVCGTASKEFLAIIFRKNFSFAPPSAAVIANRTIKVWELFLLQKCQERIIIIANKNSIKRSSVHV